MISMIYFDTNFFYNLVEEKFEDEDQIELTKVIKSGSIRASYTPITFTEITSHINRDEKSKFKYYQSILIMIECLCNNSILENPDHVLATVLKTSPSFRKEGESPLELNKVRKIICSAKSYEELVKGKICYWNGMLSKVKINEDLVKNFRADYEARWISDMYRYVINIVNPEYFEKLKRNRTPRVADKKLSQDLIDFLETKEFKKAFVDASYCKAMNLPQQTLIGQSSEPHIEGVIKSLSAYFSAYKTIIKKVIEEGYNVEKNKNDFNDLHFLIYLGLGKNIRFVSYDKKLKNKVKGSRQEKQILEIPDLLEELM